MNKIVELIIKLDELELDGVGVDAMAMVENPAIELDFLAFAQENFVKPESGEVEGDFMNRCVPALIDEGYEQDQAVAICISTWQNHSSLKPYVDQTGETKKKEEMTEVQKAMYEMLSECGEEYDPEQSVFIDVSKSNFNGVTDFLQTVGALDFLQNQRDTPGVTVYKYTGPRAERGFCQALMRLNKVYRREEIEQLNTINTQFGHQQMPYSVFEWKGGPNCKHFWKQFTMFTNANGQRVFIDKGRADGNAGKTNEEINPTLNGYWDEETKKRSEIAYAISQRFGFAADEEQRIVTGPAMLPNKMILRKDERGMPYYVYFTEKTIKDIAEKVFEENKQNMTNVEHKSTETHAENTMLESWIVADPEMDKSKALGFDVPKGTWMVSYKVNDDATWQMIKEGKLRGFSVEGYFIERAEAAKAAKAAEQMYSDIINILNQVK